MRKQVSHQEKEQGLRVTRPPRLEGKVKNAMMNPVRKKSKKGSKKKTKKS